jgi:general secretion pathway protein B
VSYILDALRKSDQLRQRGAAPTLLLGQGVTITPKQPALLQYALLSLVLLAAGVAIGWLRPWQPEAAAPAPASVIAKPPVPAQTQQPAPQAVVASTMPEPQRNTPKTAPDSAPAPQTVAAPATAPAPVKPRVSASVKQHKQPAPTRTAPEVPKKVAVPVQDRDPGSAGAAPLPAVMPIAELPLAVQQELPPMSISVHAYSSKPADRLVGINNRLLHEGQDVAPGLKLEQITPDGMILSFKGYSFRRGVH